MLNILIYPSGLEDTLLEEFNFIKGSCFRLISHHSSITWARMLFQIKKTKQKPLHKGSDSKVRWDDTSGTTELSLR